MPSVEGVVETTLGTVRILGRTDPTVEAAEGDVDTPKTTNSKPRDTARDALPRRASRSAQTTRVHLMTQLPVFIRCQLPCLLNTEPKHAVFVNHSLNIMNIIHETNPNKPFIVFVTNFANVSRNIWKHMVLCYAIGSHKLLIPVDSPLVTHVSKPLGYIAPCGPDSIEEYPPNTPPPPNPLENKPQNPWEKLLNTHAIPATGLVVSP